MPLDRRWRTVPWFFLIGLAAGGLVWVGELTQLVDFQAGSLLAYLLGVAVGGAALGARFLPPWRWPLGAAWALALLLGQLLAIMLGMVLFFNP